MPKPIIQIQNISKRYRIGAEKEQYPSLRDEITNLLSRRLFVNKNQGLDIWALKNVSFNVEEGEVVGIIGKNGAGKSTLLKILSHITPPTEGSIVMRGRVGSLLEVGTGFHPDLTGRENIYLNGAILGMPRREITSKFDEIVAFAEIEQFLDTPVKRYSSGMYVRLAFAVAAHLEPEILLVDEVLAVGDAAFQKKCLGKMGDVAKRGRTVLFVSHNMAAVEKLCQKTIVIDKGCLVYSNSSLDAIDFYLNKVMALKPTATIKDRKDRTGTGKIKLVDIKILNKDLQPAGFVSSGWPCHFDFYCESKEELKDIRIAINPFDSRTNSFSLFRLCSLDTDQSVKTFNKRGIIRCTIPKMPLVPGTYRTNVEIRVGNIIADFVENAFSIDVQGGDFYGTGRVNSHSPILIAHCWSFLENT